MVQPGAGVGSLPSLESCYVGGAWALGVLVRQPWLCCTHRGWAGEGRWSSPLPAFICSALLPSGLDPASANGQHSMWYKERGTVHWGLGQPH